MQKIKLKSLELIVLMFCSLLFIVNLWICLKNTDSVQENRSQFETRPKVITKTTKLETKTDFITISTKNNKTNNLLELNNWTHYHYYDYRLNILHSKPWFMNGTQRPKMPKKKWRLALWPEESPNSDRILNQLMYLPENYEQIKKSQTFKKILLYFGSKNFGAVNGQQKFLDDNCPVNTCTITVDKSEAPVVDAIIFENKFQRPKHERDLNQVWILYMLESPQNTQWVSNYNHDLINWTATYRLDSDIVTPYEKFVSYNSYNNDFLALKSHNEVSQTLIFENSIFYQILI
jgi:hypothetical protein